MRAKAQFGKVTVGGTPLVVGTIAGYDALCAFSKLHAGDCDIAEVRLDLIGWDKDWQPAAQAIEAMGTPTLLTLRTVDEGGKCNLSAAETRSLLEHSWAAISAIDVEHQRPEARDHANAAHRQGKAVIASFHNFQKTPAPDELLRIVRAAALYADVVKVSTMVNSQDDMSTLEFLLRSSNIDRPLCVIGMGAEGMRSRTDFPRLGSCLTYGYLDAPAAPGQLSAAELMQRVK